MRKFSLVKNSTVVLSSIIVLSSLSPSLAEAATTYKVKSGKLVVAKSNKVVKGYKVYKNTLYYNGKKKTATTLYNNTLYVKGKKATGTKVYKNVLYVKGKKATGTKVYKNVLYVKGKKATGTKVYKNVLYVKGKKATGTKVYNKVIYVSGKKVTGTKVYNKVLYLKGKQATGNKVYNKVLYVSGKQATGNKVYNNILYVSGKQSTGDKVVGTTLYVNGKKATTDKVVGNKLYQKGVLATDYVFYEGILYYNGSKFKGDYKELYYEYGVLANGPVTIDGKTVEYVNGKPKGAMDTNPIPPGTDPTTLTNAEIIALINETYQTKITPENMASVEKLLEAYNKLTAAEQNALKDKMATLQQALNKFKSELSLTAEEVNAKTEFREVTSSNIDEAKLILAAYYKLSEREKANVTYPISKLQTMVDIYTIKNAGITEVNALNAQEVQKLIQLYKGLSPADQEPLKAYIEGLENKLELFVKTNGNSFVVVTGDNYALALEALTAALKLSVEEQQALSFSVAELKSKVEAYQFNQKTVYTTINNDSDWNQALTIIREYEALSPTTLVYVNYNIEELRKVVKVYEFSSLVKNLNVNTVDGAKEFIRSYNTLPQDIKARVAVLYKEKLDAAKVTVEVDELQKQLNTAMVLNITPTSSVENVNTAKDAINAYDNASESLKSRVTANLSALKEGVAAYDFVKYFTEVVDPATKSLNGSVYIKSTNSEIAKQELVYIARMFDLMNLTMKKEYDQRLDAIFNAHIVVLDPDLNIRQINGYKIENLDNARYADITYNFEKEFKYTESMSLVKTLGR